MKHKLFFRLFFIFFVFFSITGCSHGGLDIVTNYKNIKGTVIGKEICNTDETKDDWLIDFNYGTYNL